jgi:hypothetical protein
VKVKVNYHFYLLIKKLDNCVDVRRKVFDNEYREERHAIAHLLRTPLFDENLEGVFHENIKR